MTFWTHDFDGLEALAWFLPIIAIMLMLFGAIFVAIIWELRFGRRYQSRLRVVLSECDMALRQVRELDQLLAGARQATVIERSKPPDQGGVAMILRLTFIAIVPAFWIAAAVCLYRVW